MVKNIIFDLGGVLIDFDPDRTLGGAFGEDALPLLRDVLFDSGLWKQLDLGKMSLAQVAAVACEKLPASMHDALTAMLIDWWSYMPPIDGMEEFVREVKSAGCGVYLLSNTSDDVYKNFDNYPVLSLMDGICASCDFGVMKPDPRLYRALYEKFSLDPAECFFIDDLQQNIDGAAQTGMAGHCFADRNVPRLREAMRRLDIRI